MPIEGLHHITAITADAPANVDFYARLLGLRLVKKTVNFDAPEVYHLYYGDETGHPGSILTFFEFPRAPLGRAGDGMVHTIQWRVGSEAAIGFWADRLGAAGVASERDEGYLRFADPEGLAHELLAVEVADAPLVAAADDVPAEHALRGFHGVRAYASEALASSRLLGRLGFVPAETEGVWTARGNDRHGVLRYESPPPQTGRQGAGTIHHIAWNVADDAELELYRGAVHEGGGQPTPIIDRQYFHSVYFHEPSGILFELASRDIGFDADEPVAHLGEALRLPPQHEHLRPQLEAHLVPLFNPRSRQSA